MMLPPFLQRWLILNILRILTIISCLLVIASTIRVLVTNFQHYPSPTPSDPSSTYPGTDIPTSFLGVFWSTQHHVSLCVVLFTVILSELSLPVPLLNRVFKSTLPFLGPNWGSAFLGVLLVLVAGDALSRPRAGVFREATNWALACTGVANVVSGCVWRAKAKLLRTPMGWKRDVAEKMDKLAEAKAVAERIDAILPTSTFSTKGESNGGGVLGGLVGKAGRMLDKRLQRKTEKAVVDEEKTHPTVEKEDIAAKMAIFAPPLPSAIVSARTIPAPTLPNGTDRPPSTSTISTIFTTSSSATVELPLHRPPEPPAVKSVRFHSPSPTPTPPRSPSPSYCCSSRRPPTRPPPGWRRPRARSPQPGPTTIPAPAPTGSTRATRASTVPWQTTSARTTPARAGRC